MGAATGGQAEDAARVCATWPATSRTTACRPTLTIDRDTASRLGITPQAIDDTLYDAFGQRQVSTIFTQLNQYHVMLEVMPNFARDPTDLKDIYVRPSVVTPNSGARTANGAAVSTSGAPVPIAAFTHMNSASASLAINHQGHFPSVTLSFNLAPGASLGEAVQADSAGGDGHPACRPAFRRLSRARRRPSRLRWPTSPA